MDGEGSWLYPRQKKKTKRKRKFPIRDKLQPGLKKNHSLAHDTDYNKPVLLDRSHTSEVYN